MKKFSYLIAFAVSGILIALTVLSGCSSPPAETITATETAWKTSTVTTTSTVPVPTTVTITSPTTITVTSTVNTSGTTTTSFSTSASTTTANPYSHFHGYLLEGYPEDIWPLYGELAIDSCALDIQFPSYNATGVYVNRYNVIYVTDKTQEEITEYYNSLLQTTEDSSFYDAVGTIGGYEVDARWDYWSGDNIVYLSVLLPNTLNITSNPFHADFPESLENLYELGNMWAEDYTCNSNPPAGEIIASKLFSHTGSFEEALDYYRALYGDTQDYEETITEKYEGQSIHLSGVIDDLSFTVIIGVWGKADMIQISYSKSQQG